MAAACVAPEVPARQHDAVTRMTTDALGHGPLEHGDPRPPQCTVWRAARHAVQQDERTDTVCRHGAPTGGQPERHGAAHRVPDDDGIAQVEALEHERDIVDQVVEVELVGDRRGTAETPVVHRHHATTLRREPRREWGEDRQVCTVPVDEEDRRDRPALLDMDPAAVGDVDLVRGLGRERKTFIGVGIGCCVESSEDASLVDGHPEDETAGEQACEQRWSTRARTVPAPRAPREMRRPQS